MSFSDFNLKEEFVTSIEAAGYLSPTPLQTELIPLIAARKSAVITTQSVSGKTGAFLIPAINYILENPAPEKRGARILILTSRRDRVSQINYTIKRLSSEHHMRFGFIVSGRPYQTQMRLMRRPLDIMIATPGRLSDLMNNGKADFSQLEMLIIDDLSSIYQKNLQSLVEDINKQTNDDCNSITFVQGNDDVTTYAQSLFPNATLLNSDDETIDDDNVDEHNHNKETSPQASHKNNNKPDKEKETKPIKVGKLMPQKVHIADDYTHKIAMMDHLMDEFSGEPTWIYTATNKAAKTLQDNLSNHGHTAELIQELNPEEFDECDILIVSDQEKLDVEAEVIAENDTHIIHFDLPRKTEQYLERLKRHNQDREEATLLMIDGYNYNELKHIESTIGDKLEQSLVPGLEPLKPFVNLSKPKSNHRQKNQRNNNNKSQAKNNTQKRNNNNRSKNSNSNKKNASSADSTQRRQRKGPFGRLNGGANKKNSSNENNNPRGRRNHHHQKVGVSTRGTATPKSDRGWQSDFAEPQERKTESKNVVIRYSKKRIILDKGEDA